MWTEWMCCALLLEAGWIPELIEHIKTHSIEASWLWLNALLDIIQPLAWVARRHPLDELQVRGSLVLKLRQRWHVKRWFNRDWHGFEKQLKDTRLSW